MSLPPYPPPSGPTNGGRQLGLYPLRPLRIGEIFAAAVRVAWRHLTVLAPLALLAGVVALGVQFSLLASSGSLHDYASGQLLAIPVNPTQADLNALVDRLVRDYLPAVLVSSLISLIAGPILAGIATPFAALGATSTVSTNGAGLARLRGRWGVLLGSGVVVGLAIAVGSVLLVVPGIMAWLILLPAGPVAAMEGSTLGDSIKRAAVVSKGFKGRLFGVSILSSLISGAIALVVSSIVGRLVSTEQPISHLVVTSVATVLVGALTVAWSSSVVAMLYIDIRIRREGLAQALAAAAGPSRFS
ncbi:hypothetical protein ABIB25_000670 [Nakamurella sp. UYEF19]|uniref:hypothetical protein n=1 Tax=Nakamurella sp. UYEF19 TaxID=1756392 RepID=UPI003393F071